MYEFEFEYTNGRNELEITIAYVVATNETQGLFEMCECTISRRYRRNSDVAELQLAKIPAVGVTNLETNPFNSILRGPPIRIQT